MKRAEILGALSQMSQADLATVRSACDHLLGGHTGAIETGATTLAATLFEALTAPLNRHIAYANYRATRGGKQFDHNASKVVLFLNKEFPGWDSNRVSQLAFLKMLFGLLIDDLKARKVTPTIGILAVNLGRLPEVFDNAFPNYLEAGLGPYILRNFQTVSKAQMGQRDNK